MLTEVDAEALTIPLGGPRRTAARRTAAAHSGVYASSHALIGSFADALRVTAAFSAAVASPDRTRAAATAAVPLMTGEES